MPNKCKWLKVFLYVSMLQHVSMLQYFNHRLHRHCMPTHILCLFHNIRDITQLAR